MARAGPRKVRAYSREFKLTAVRLSQQPGLEVQAVAAALDIHPFMLSKWRKQVRDGVLRGRGRYLRVPPPREIRRLQELEDRLVQGRCPTSFLLLECLGQFRGHVSDGQVLHEALRIPECSLRIHSVKSIRSPSRVVPGQAGEDSLG